MEKTGLISLAAFVAVAFALPSLRNQSLKRSAPDWIIDLASLAVHLFALPLLQGGATYFILQRAFPGQKAGFDAPVWMSIALYLSLDYLWYWNHRLFHAETPLWSLHKTHHSAENLDVLMTARNSVLSHFAMIYFWFVGATVYFLKDPGFFLALAGVGGIINYWGHTPFNFPLGGKLDRLVGFLIVSPQDHSWHHSRENSRCNYGTVLNIWDRIHGTYYKPAKLPESFGDPGEKRVWDQLIWPFSSSSESDATK